MTALNPIILLALVTLAALVLNLPFGYMRAKTKKLSVMWFLYIHVPIPFIFILRTLAGFGIQFIPIIAAGAIIGQLLGGKLNNAKAS
ncbi:MAG: hypothetical protein HYS21_06085 [Deltaproteobacteria bacterium]|nr:hypothetical protein [Deltaproteobacteria bacterium]